MVLLPVAVSLVALAADLSSLDFWVGNWDVVSSDGKKLGDDTVEKSMNGNVVIEHWKGVDDPNDVGISFFYFMPAKKGWKQVWATPMGVYKEKLSEPFPGGIRFSGTVYLPKGRTYIDRTTLTKMEGGKVHQVIESSLDGGKTWRTGFDAIYQPAKT